MTTKPRIAANLARALGLFVSVPLTALPAVAQDKAAGRMGARVTFSGERVGKRIESIRIPALTDKGPQPPGIRYPGIRYPGIRVPGKGGGLGSK
ncbi:hypothetical protein [Tropicibacter sp. S64]|uniref:hypothetical protein n=1 Tax=Tropicibacter sp. S64 TaxID=3415122 RepID=UPI003C7A2CEA